ncbi:hypothetical protein B840_12600 (plasmid) [Corynebacterium marinum DSM 44953]|uniref:Uncharacterized protein n=1 Tax=Corynebacterium marinum DSM 44953 TaxID=1224162 RepID=A0A0B6TQ88_9CORY|nr:hypothetical protein B840_12600 [Corynebacterium marinum DSM 44953]
MVRHFSCWFPQEPRFSTCSPQVSFKPLVFQDKKERAVQFCITTHHLARAEGEHQTELFPRAYGRCLPPCPHGDVGTHSPI